MSTSQHDDGPSPDPERPAGESVDGSTAPASLAAPQGSAGGAPERLDLLLVRRGLARSRGQARDLVEAGVVEVDGRIARKASVAVAPHARVVADPVAARWVSRSARKLWGAFEEFGAGRSPSEPGSPPLTAEGRRCLDLGACTGGFTQVLLEKGAGEVIALDVGHDQLDPSIAADPRVTERSGTTLRGLVPSDIGGEVDLVVADLSFISLRLVMSEIATLLRPEGEAVLLVKPQFEVGRHRLTKTGLVRRAEDRIAAIDGVITAAEQQGLHVLGLTRSPIHGGEGNREYLLRVAPRPGVGSAWQARHRIADVVQEG